MHTEWSDPPHFPGRFIATKSSVESQDVTAAAAFRVTPKLGIGAGVIYRTADISASRITGALSNDRQSSTGFSAGILYRPLAHWSFAFTHRNEIGVFPAQTNGGVAWRPSESFVFEIDADHTAWSRVRELVIGGVRFPLNLEDTKTLRAGFRHRLSPRTEWHLGYAAERTAQPDQTVGAFMHDAQRSTYGAGIAFRGVDVAFSWSTDELREITTNIDQFNGNYRRNMWLLAVTVTR
jgi:long-subunit fatty acid transport protein